MCRLQLLQRVSRRARAAISCLSDFFQRSDDKVESRLDHCDDHPKFGRRCKPFVERKAVKTATAPKSSRSPGSRPVLMIKRRQPGSALSLTPAFKPVTLRERWTLAVLTAYDSGAPCPLILIRAAGFT